MEQQNDPTMTLLETVRNSIPAPALYEALAEEASELAQAALKIARIQRNENPTPVDMVDAVKNLNEEVTDVLLCLDVVNVHADQNIAMAKLSRWTQRLQVTGKFQPENRDREMPIEEGASDGEETEG